MRGGGISTTRPRMVRGEKGEKEGIGGGQAKARLVYDKRVGAGMPGDAQHVGATKAFTASAGPVAGSAMIDSASS